MLTDYKFIKFRDSAKIGSIRFYESGISCGARGTAIAIPTKQIIGKQDIVPCRTCDLQGRGLISEDLDTSFTVSYAHGTGGELPHRIPRTNWRCGEFHFRNHEGP